MADLFHCYTDYRATGFGRLRALRFAWLVATAGGRPIPPRLRVRR